MEFKVGEMIYLKIVIFKGNSRAKNIGKLKPRFMGPYEIVEWIGVVAYKLNMPHVFRNFHNVFHVSLVRKVVKDPEFIVTHPLEDLRVDLMVEGRPRRTKEKGR